MRWLIKYYHTRHNWSIGHVDYQQYCSGSKQAAINQAEGLIRNGGYECYEIEAA